MNQKVKEPGAKVVECHGQEKTEDLVHEVISIQTPHRSGEGRKIRFVGTKKSGKVIRDMQLPPFGK